MGYRTEHRIVPAEARVVSMRELTQHTAQVVERIRESGQPTILTKHGRFLAIITPVDDSAVIDAVLNAPSPFMAHIQERSGRQADAEQFDSWEGVDTEDVAGELNVHLPPRLRSIGTLRFGRNTRWDIGT